MNKKIIIASLIVASSSVAMASPSVTLSASAKTSYGTTTLRDRHPEPIAQPTYYREGGVWRGEWKPPVVRPIVRPVVLGSNLHFAGDGRTFLTVGAGYGRFGTLKINADSGRTFIQQVYVQFDNGQEQVIRNINRTLIGDQSLTLDLDGNRRNIARIVVYGKELHGGWNNGWRRASGAFNVTAL